MSTNSKSIISFFFWKRAPFVALGGHTTFLRLELLSGGTVQGKFVVSGILSLKSL